MHDRVLLAYYAADRTASYIWLIHEYVLNIDRSIIDQKITAKNSSTTNVRRTVELAAKWIATPVLEEGLFIVSRSTARRNSCTVSALSLEVKYYSQIHRRYVVFEMLDAQR